MNADEPLGWTGKKKRQNRVRDECEDGEIKVKL